MNLSTATRAEVESAVASGALALFLRTNTPDNRAPAPEAKGFLWPEEGYVAAPDWSAAPICGYGLHGLLDGKGKEGFLRWLDDSKWCVFAAVRATAVDLDGKHKVPEAYVLISSDKTTAVGYLESRVSDTSGMIALIKSVGDSQGVTGGARSTVSAGNYGQATAGNSGQATAGDSGQATAGDSGQATAGYNGKATAGNYGKAAAGNYGQATAGNSGQATAGDSGQATAGNYGKAKTGEKGLIAINWYDQKAERYRLAVGYVGEDGIEADTWYVVVDGKLEKA